MQLAYHITLSIIFVLLMLPGIVAVLMMLPGIPYIFIMAVIYALLDHFVHVTGVNILVLALILIASLIVDQSAGLIAARWGGARGKTFLFGFIGAMLGTFILPLFGGFIGLFIGLLIGELYRRNHLEGETKKAATVGALKAATSGLIGSATGVAINTGFAILSIALFCYFVW